MFCLSLGEIYLSFGISLLASPSLCGFALILSAILLPIKSPLAFAVFLSIFLPAVLAKVLLKSIPLSSKDLLYIYH